MRLTLISLLMIPLAIGCGDKDAGSTAPAESDCDDGFGMADDENCYPIDPTPSEDRIEGSEAGDCSDDADNDLDGLFDCDDDGCEGSKACEDADETWTVQRSGEIWRSDRCARFGDGAGHSFCSSIQIFVRWSNKFFNLIDLSLMCFLQ